MAWITKWSYPISKFIHGLITEFNTPRLGFLQGRTLVKQKKLAIHGIWILLNKWICVKGMQDRKMGGGWCWFALHLAFVSVSPSFGWKGRARGSVSSEINNSQGCSWREIELKIKNMAYSLQRTFLGRPYFHSTIPNVTFLTRKIRHYPSRNLGLDKLRTIFLFSQVLITIPNKEGIFTEPMI